MYFDKLDTRLWEEVQDKFSREMGLAIYAVDREGKEVLASGESPFLIELIRSKREDILHERNYNALNELDGENIVALHNLFGAVHLLKPVFLHDKMIGAVIAGPIRKEDYDYSTIAARVGGGEEELSDAAGEIKEATQEEVIWYRKMIAVLGDILPKLSYQKQSRDKQISELTTLQSIIKMVNSTLEIDDVMRNIMEFLVSGLRANDCSVFVKTEEGEKKYCLKEGAEKLAEIEKAVSNKAIEEKQIVIVKDIKKRFGIDVNEEYGSMLSIPLKLKEEIIGSINVYGSSVGNVSDDGLGFLSVMAAQVAIAIANAQRYGEVKELAVVDKLTGVKNRRYFTEMLENALAEGISVENPIGLVLLDIDNFGKYNNAHGHPQGDELLKELSKIINENTREGDVVGRYGGEEFIIMLPKATPQSALDVASRIKNAVAGHPFYGRETQPGGKVTISAGLVVCRTNISSRELIKEADEALYKAKNSGKNKVVQKVILTNNLKAEI
jgi:diguanylate cyclase (GGDEF)-like protein